MQEIITVTLVRKKGSMKIEKMSLDQLNILIKSLSENQTEFILLENKETIEVESVLIRGIEQKERVLLLENTEEVK